MLDASNFDPRPLRIRIMSVLTYPMWMTTQQVAEKTGDAHYTVSAMMSKMYLYGGPIERQRVSNRHNKFQYRFKPVTKT